jgi:hypothetical protein
VGRISGEDFFEAPSDLRRIVGHLAQPPPGIDLHLLRRVPTQKPLQKEPRFLFGSPLGCGDPADEKVSKTVRSRHPS